MPAITLNTPVPGPKSQALLQRRAKVVARGLSTAHLLFIERGEGATLTDVDGNTFIDFCGGIGTMNIGHGRVEVVKAAFEQASRVTHTAIQVAGYESYIACAEALCRLAPMSGDKAAMMVTTGTEAVENAVKLARSYTKRPAVLCFEHAFHGRSLGALSFTSRYRPYKVGFGPFLPEVYRLPYPYPYREGLSAAESVERFKTSLAQAFHTVIAPSQVAAIMVETVPGEGGFLAPPAGFLEHLREVCTREGIVFIIDEVQAGFGRTGKLFAIQHFGVEPDLMTCGKSLAAGFPLGAVVGRAEIVNSSDPGGLGGTYGGNPMACAAAVESMALFEREKLVERGAAMGKKLEAALRGLAEKHPLIGDVRGLGAMQAIELVTNRKTREPATAQASKVQAEARARGLLLLTAGTFGNVIRFLMPLNIDEAVLNEGLTVLDQALEAARA
ncbi:MAG: 4-aminobutyrate--2-oxoglutarate transaminase [Archangiaceae bacterium]|nr:4-aminobutyrate--2-oxoglutarate transaminase [Archangiaceae bacterium]